MDRSDPQISEPIAGATGKRVVIVGAGFGGLATAKALKRTDAEVVLIDRTNHNLFQPLLYQVATAALSPADIATPTRALLRNQSNVTVIMGEVIGVDAVANVVSVDGHRDVPFDFLVLATGAGYSFFGHDEWSDHALVLKSLDDALTIRERVLGSFEMAESSENAAEIARLLTFVVVGGGPTGVELAGTIAELANATLAEDFRRIDPTSARIFLFEAGDRVLPSFPHASSAYAVTALEALGVTVNLQTPVDLIDQTGLRAGGAHLSAATILWCAGTAARPAAAWLNAVAAGNGAVVVGANCDVPGHDHVFAVGDVTSFRDARGRTLPGLAPVAKQQGQHVGRLIAARLARRPAPKPFAYRNLGTMAVIGRSRAVADLGWTQLHAGPAWFAWSMVHLLLLVDFRSRLSVYLNWGWAWFTYGRGARLLTKQAATSSSDADIRPGVSQGDIGSAVPADRKRSSLR